MIWHFYYDGRSPSAAAEPRPSDEEFEVLIKESEHFSEADQQNKKRKSNGAVGPRCRLALNLLAGRRGKKILRNRRCSRQLIASGKRSFLPPSIVVHHTTSRTRKDQTAPAQTGSPVHRMSKYATWTSNIGVYWLTHCPCWRNKIHISHCPALPTLSNIFWLKMAKKFCRWVKQFSSFVKIASQKYHFIKMRLNFENILVLKSVKIPDFQCFHMEKKRELVAATVTAWNQGEEMQLVRSLCM